jgi:manganese/zinc/iron transport system ATP- binding protein
MSAPAIKVEDLHVNYEKRSVLWDISFEIPKGQMVAIVGPNGAGKSTLLKSLLGLIKPLTGKISVQSHIAYVPQRESVDWDFPITAEEVVLMGRFGKLGLFGKIKKADREAARAALEQVGMSAYAETQIGQLSGGQQQRLFLARAILQDEDLLLLDEPFSGIDLATEKAIIALLRKQKELGKTILIVHHDLPTVPEYFDWAVLLNTRLVAYGPIAEIFTKNNFARTFGRSEQLFEEAAHLSAKSLSGQL